MADICTILSLILGLAIAVLVIVGILIALITCAVTRPGSGDEFRRIGAKACHKAQNLSEDFLQKASDLLNEKRR